jgi:translation initiation factor IF-1
MTARSVSLIVAAAWGLVPGPACAQEAPAEGLQRALDRCQGAHSADLRIACLEAELEFAYLGRQEPRAAAARPESPGEPAPPEMAAADRLGAAQVAARTARRAPEDPGRMTARVEQAEVVPYRRLQVQLDNGQVWRQIQGDTQRITIRGADPLTVEIWEARAGGYQMRLNELGRTIRVERLR